MKKRVYILPNHDIGGAEKIVRAMYAKDSAALLLVFSDFDNIFRFYMENLRILSGASDIIISHLRLLPILFPFTLFKQKLIFRLSTKGKTRYSGRKRFLYVCVCLFLVFVKKIILQTKEMRAEIPAYFLKKSEVIPNPVIVPEFDGGMVSHDKPYVFLASRLIELKNISFAIRILASGFSTLDLIIAGDGPEKDRLQNEAVRLGISERVHFVGHVESIAFFASQAEFCLHTSFLEGFPNTVLEYRCVNSRVFATPSTKSISDLPGVNIISYNTTEAVERIRMILNQDTSTSDMKWKEYMKENSIESYFNKIFMKTL